MKESIFKHIFTYTLQVVYIKTSYSRDINTCGNNLSYLIGLDTMTVWLHFFQQYDSTGTQFRLIDDDDLLANNSY